MLKIGEVCKRPARLEKWSVVWTPYSDFLSLPELAPPQLHGEVYGHPRFPDGTPITTSFVTGRRGGRVITKSGTEYDLGDVDPAYEAMFPGARESVFSKLREIS